MIIVGARRVPVTIASIGPWAAASAGGLSLPSIGLASGSDRGRLHTLQGA